MILNVSVLHKSFSLYFLSLHSILLIYYFSLIIRTSSCKLPYWYIYIYVCVCVQYTSSNLSFYNINTILLSKGKKRSRYNCKNLIDWSSSTPKAQKWKLSLFLYVSICRIQLHIEHNTRPCVINYLLTSI